MKRALVRPFFGIPGAIFYAGVIGFETNHKSMLELGKSLR